MWLNNSYLKGFELYNPLHRDCRITPDKKAVRKHGIYFNICISAMSPDPLKSHSFSCTIIFPILDFFSLCFFFYFFNRNISVHHDFYKWRLGSAFRNVVSRPFSHSFIISYTQVIYDRWVINFYILCEINYFFDNFRLSSQTTQESIFTATYLEEWSSSFVISIPFWWQTLRTTMKKTHKQTNKQPKLFPTHSNFNLKETLGNIFAFVYIAEYRGRPGFWSVIIIMISKLNEVALQIIVTSRRWFRSWKDGASLSSGWSPVKNLSESFASLFRAYSKYLNSRNISFFRLWRKR